MQCLFRDSVRVSMVEKCFDIWGSLKMATVKSVEFGNNSFSINHISVGLKFSGGRGGDTFKTPSPYEQLLPLPTPCFKMFLEKSLYDPHPTTPLQASFTAAPFLIYHPPPPKILLIHLLDVDLNFYFWDFRNLSWF